jgi:hypothetical protein
MFPHNLIAWLSLIPSADRWLLLFQAAMMTGAGVCLIVGFRMMQITRRALRLADANNEAEMVMAFHAGVRAGAEAMRLGMVAADAGETGQHNLDIRFERDEAGVVRWSVKRRPDAAPSEGAPVVH